MLKLVTRQFVIASLIGSGLAVLCAKAAWANDDEARRQPNFLVIVADDLGWGDVGYQNPRRKTPFIDQLAGEGIRLDQYYVAPMCSPTRAGLLTGRYWSRFGVTAATNERVLRFDTLTLSHALHKVGYESALIGKWHLGSKPENGPRHFGFDHTYGSLAGGIGPIDHRYKNGPFSRVWHRDDVLIEEQGHVTDLIADEAIRWLESRGDKPFLLYVPFTAVHIPILEEQKWLDLHPEETNLSRKHWAACLSHMDDAMRRIVATLDRTGKRDNTLVLFFGDNGAPPNARNDDPQFPNPTQYPAGPAGGTNEPFRGQKTQLYEGGIRTPALVHWPAQLKPGRYAAPIHVIDWMPTLCQLAGFRPDNDPKWDGRDVWPWLTRQQPAEPRNLYWAGVGYRSRAVRSGDWKLIVASDQDWTELFDLSKDPQEKENLAPDHPDRVAQLREMMTELSASDRFSLPIDSQAD